MDETIDNFEFVTSCTCCIRQGFPLPSSNSKTNGQSSLFVDCISTQNEYYGDDTHTIALSDLSQAHVILSFDDLIPRNVTKKTNPGIGRSKYENGADERTLVSREQTQKLDEVVKSVNSIRNDKDMNETEVYAWGDNTCNCLVSVLLTKLLNATLTYTMKILTEEHLP